MQAWEQEPSWDTLLNLTPSSPRDNPFDSLFDLDTKPGEMFKMAGDASSSFLSPGRVAQMGQDMAWKTILQSAVHVESIGDVSVARLLKEIWKRGGGDVVSAVQVTRGL
jgi:hypothetical protein